MKLQVPFRMPRQLVMRLAHSPSRRERISGMPPPTAASKATLTLPERAAR